MVVVLSVIFIPTPQSIKDDTLVDVFEQIIPNTAYQYQKKRSELWYRYRYRGIGNCDQAYWIQCMKDRYALIEETWDIKIKAWEAYQTSITANGINFAEGASKETQTDTRSFTNAHTGTITDGGDNGTVTVEREDTPDNPAGTTKYLAERTTTKSTAANANTRTFLNTDTLTNAGTLVTDMEYFQSLESDTVDKYIKAVPDPWDGFTSQFRELFCFSV